MPLKRKSQYFRELRAKRKPYKKPEDQAANKHEYSTPNEESNEAMKSSETSLNMKDKLPTAPEKTERTQKKLDDSEEKNSA